MLESSVFIIHFSKIECFKPWFLNDMTDKRDYHQNNHLVYLDHSMFVCYE